MNILMLAINDPAGTGIQFCRAVNRHTAHTCRIATLETRYTHSWEKDLHVPDLDENGLAELERLFQTSDILHFHMTADEFTRFGPFLPADHLAGKAIVHHHHGHHDFRSAPETFREKYARLGRRNLLVSTPDLLRLLPEARWQPNLVPLDDPGFTPSGIDPREGPLRVAHSPTRKDLKNTDDLLAAVGELSERGIEIELDLIDDVPNRECLERKRRCHVLFDHMQGYYGVSSLEGLSQGLAVIAGLDEWNMERIHEFTGAPELPWVIARDRDSLRDALTVLDADRELCQQTGLRSRAFMERFWSDARVAGHLAEFWENT
ncbi:glycosyltransferase [Desulfovibrio oxyclinae]|uniref:glycosyltransferase n=1 Tax=Desulfovibrio oxyclinae TaxID=63560 RepID=UPI0003773F96|nr:glycosyltransferase [Desulfovibrio oxyclinae]